MSIICTDQFRVTIAGDSIPWDSMQGGAAHRTGFEPLTLKRVRSDASGALLTSLIHRTGTSVEVRVEHLNAGRSATGHGLKYYGTLLRVEPAGYDANSRAIALDSAVIRPIRIAPIV